MEENTTVFSVLKIAFCGIELTLLIIYRLDECISYYF